MASASIDRAPILIAGFAGLIAGAMSMAAGEYVSVSSQRDSEAADLKREAAELREDPKAELAELTGIYVQRGLEPDLAAQVAAQLMAKNPLQAHARDELGVSDETAARPLQAAFALVAAGGQGRRGADEGGGVARHLLGRDRHGGHGRRGPVVWNRGLEQRGGGVIWSPVGSGNGQAADPKGMAMLNPIGFDR